MRKTFASAAVAFALLASTAPAQFGGGGGGMGGGFGGGMGGMMSMMGGGRDFPQNRPPAKAWAVRVETVGGQSVTGTLDLGSVPIACDLGFYLINADKVKQVRFGPQQQPVIVGPNGTQAQGVVVTTTGQEIAGTLQISQWVVRTDLGQLALVPDRIKSLTLTGPAEGAGRATTKAALSEEHRGVDVRKQAEPKPDEKKAFEPKPDEKKAFEPKPDEKQDVEPKPDEVKAVEKKTDNP